MHTIREFPQKVTKDSGLTYGITPKVTEIMPEKSLVRI
jgi:hypothetical protein